MIGKIITSVGVIGICGAMMAADSLPISTFAVVIFIALALFMAGMAIWHFEDNYTIIIRRKGRRSYWRE